MEARIGLRVKAACSVADVWCPRYDHRMFWMFRPVVWADQALIEGVFQPLVDGFPRAERARYWLAAVSISIWAIAWLLAGAIGLKWPGQLGLSPIYDVVWILAQSAMGYWGIASAVRHDRLAMDIGIDGYEPNHVFFGRYRLGYFCAAFVVSIFAVAGFARPFMTVVATYVVAELLARCFLSCEDPRPGRGRRGSFPRTAPPGPVPGNRVVETPVMPSHAE